MPLAVRCTPVPQARGGGGGRRWAPAGPCGPGPHVQTPRLSGPHPAAAPTARLGQPRGSRGQQRPARPLPRRSQRQPRPALQGPCTISGSPPPFPAAGRRAEWKQRRSSSGGAGTKGPGGGGGGLPVRRALLPDHLLVRRQQLQAVAAEADAGHAEGRTEAERTDAQTDGQRKREGTKESSPPPPPRSLCSDASRASQRPGEGSRPAGGGGRWLRPARPSALGPSAAPAGPRGRPAPPSRPAPGAPAPLTHRSCARSWPDLHFPSEARLTCVPNPQLPCSRA